MVTESSRCESHCAGLSVLVSFEHLPVCGYIHHAGLPGHELGRPIGMAKAAFLAVYANCKAHKGGWLCFETDAYAFLGSLRHLFHAEVIRQASHRAATDMLLYHKL